MGDWKNANVVISQIGQVNGLVDETKYDLDYPISESLSPDNFRNYINTSGEVITVSFGAWQTIYFNYGHLTYGADGYGYIGLYDNNDNVIVEITGLLFWLSTTDLYLIAGIDEDNKEGRIGLYIKPQSGAASGVNFNAKAKNSIAYEFITQNTLGATVKVTYDFPDGVNYEFAKLVYKKNKIPTNVNDGRSIDLNLASDNVMVSGLDKSSGTKYYFVIFTDKGASAEFVYEVAPVPPFVSQDFEKTDNIETFVVPKTGRYKLETWGAQGGNAVSGNVSARGGYGSYSTCEIELAKGQTIYVNVGGQDGYNCGGEISI